MVYQMTAWYNHYMFSVLHQTVLVMYIGISRVCQPIYTIHATAIAQLQRHRGWGLARKTMTR